MPQRGNETRDTSADSGCWFWSRKVSPATGVLPIAHSGVCARTSFSGLDFQEADVPRSFLVDRDDVEHPHELARAEHELVAGVDVVGVCGVARLRCRPGSGACNGNNSSSLGGGERARGGASRSGLTASTQFRRCGFSRMTGRERRVKDLVGSDDASHSSNPGVTGATAMTTEDPGGPSAEAFGIF
jgi:hypothetical protein